MTTHQVSLLVPKDLVKTTKDALAHHNLLDKTNKIKHTTTPQTTNPVASWPQANRAINSEADIYLLPTALTVLHACPTNLEQVKIALLKDVDMDLYSKRITATTTAATQASKSKERPTTTTTKPTPLSAALSSWLSTLPADLLVSVNLTIAALLAAFPKTYTIYTPLLLLPPNTFSSPPWRLLIANLRPGHVQGLCKALATAMKVTHVAINAPIPPLLETNNTTTTTTTTTNANANANYMRIPTHITPLHGVFGPLLPPKHIPTPSDFDRAFWISTVQNGIYQTWAPRYTMFSRGNVSEKARILRLPALTTSPSVVGSDRGIREEGKCTAVDLYAGIGYFAFSYAHAAAVERVLGWELSAWSVEGLRRGAAVNNWTVKVIEAAREDGDVDVDEDLDGDEKIIVFKEDNLHALRRIQKVRTRLDPVRHVNCGLLPTSRGSWDVAVGVLDPGLGGWIHAHENIAVEDIGSRTVEIVDIFTTLVNGDERDARKQRKVECQHLERVKSYAPGVMHCVLDIYISPPPKPISPEQED
ncbi:MAG: hypothetical protein M1830_008773 [Pleopsidium flavum]|nr:MAG: hypothetical protein M1830_008773 [Pleopsidium flavum]